MLILIAYGIYGEFPASSIAACSIRIETRL
jgi:hypothetical protein